ncbi:M28 family metallopeptidase [Polymorphobacter fuscus]|uniref:M20/M25/M40 family metallo-hydrolase n=1 Tax=Sandarakinorhabdus fusca TaxID=1439888 RepID=A0A7C9GP29_9SPHN|nr:M28 family metallopeptidase [Polymorphobacter fuscus]KAB7647410.1 M20/M25/M40 family metallo-hydrolase [Polymorphobacter fuscus]MQT16656.1 M20/M25/M40 family metallo-hydrolase [Polymorphobacter fuscus]NJC09359.1 Zn-dependent M28 family amino/carboxypeptidase [Polymorphobacter fuscus]
MKLLLSAAVILAAVPAVAAEPSFSPDRVKAHVAFLADDLLEGRGTGTRGYDIAARYVASQFAAAGLKPGARDGSWYQPVTLSETRLDGPASLTVTGAGADKTVWDHGSEAIVSPSQLETQTDVSAPLVFAGFGLDAPKQGFDDYAGLNVRGKIVVVLSGIPKGPPDEVLAHLGTEKARMAAARGAIGVITIPTLQSAKLRPWDKLQATASVPRMTWVQTDGTPFVAAPGIRASAAVSSKGAETLFAGSPTPLAAVLAAADADRGHPKGFALKTSARITATSARRTVTSSEIVGRIEGSDPVLKNENVVLMAHLDHLGIRPEKSGDNIYNGALDNAAGVAVMLEAARAFASDEKAPKRSLLFVANTAEEKGLLGAESFANDPPVPIDSIASVVDLDQPLLLYPFTDVIAFGGDHSTMGASIAKAVAKAGVTLSPDPMPAETIFVRSDHYTFVKRGVPALLLATGFANGGKAAWEHFLSTDYHQPSDDMKQPIDWDAAAKYARVGYLISKEIADAPDRPRWYAGDYFGTTFAPKAAKAPAPAAK